MAKKQQTSAGGEPPLDFFDLSYVTPLLIANTLREKPFIPYRVGSSLRMAGAIAQLSGNMARKFIFEKFFKTLAIDVEQAMEHRSALIANWLVSQYAPRPYHHIILGPPLGSMAYLSCVLDAPFLPLNYRMAIRHQEPLDPDKSEDHAKSTKEIAAKIFSRDDDIELVNEYDPVHERMRISNAALMRFKFRTLPRSYVQFIRRNLAPGGTIILVESRTAWTQYKLKDKLFFQIGLTGGISDEEFLRGSKRLSEFREKFLGEERVLYRIKARSEVLPESRFGVSPELRASIIGAAAQINKPVCQLFTADIHQLNHLVSNLYLRCARREGKRPRRFFIHSGLFLAPAQCMNSLLLPLWVPDNSFPSFTFVKQFLSSYPFETDLSLLALEPCVTGPPDVVEFSKWREVAAEHGHVRVIATKPKVFPYDITSYFKFWQAMQSASKRLKDPLDIRVNIDMLIEEAEKCRIYFTMYQR